MLLPLIITMSMLLGVGCSFSGEKMLVRHTAYYEAPTSNRGGRSGLLGAFEEFSSSAAALGALTKQADYLNKRFNGLSGVAVTISNSLAKGEVGVDEPLEYPVGYDYVIDVITFVRKQQYSNAVVLANKWKLYNAKAGKTDEWEVTYAINKADGVESVISTMEKEYLPSFNRIKQSLSK